MTKKALILGPILILVGLLLLTRTTGLIYFDFGDFLRLVVPLFLIGAGVWLIVRKRRQEILQRELPPGVAGRADVVRPEPAVGPPPPPPPGPEEAASPGAGRERQSQTPRYDGRKVRYSGFLGDLYVDLRDVSLQSVEVSAFVGDVEVTLQGAKVEDGLNRMVISGFVGDVRVTVPKGMAVFANCSSFVGDIDVLGRRSSGFGSNIDAQTAGYQDAAAKLYIAANCFIGDIRIYEF
jgi:lia operon protein LiaF